MCSDEPDIDFTNPSGVGLSPVPECDESDEDDPLQDEGVEIGPASPSDLTTGEDYTEPEEISDVEHPGLRKSDTVFISGRTDTHHPVSELCDFSLFESVGPTSKNLGPGGELAKDKMFYSKKQLSLAICHFAVFNNYVVITKESNKQKLIMNCQKWDCPWRLYARVERMCTEWRIIKNEKAHTCSRPLGFRDHENLTAALIAETIREELRQNLGLNIKAVASLMRMKYEKVQPKYNKLWRGRELAIQQLFGSWEGSYDKLPRILSAIQQTTPGTKYAFRSARTNDLNVRIFICAAWAYGPCIEAVQYLRPVITIDAGFLSGRYQGKLLMVCGYDAENRVLPLAFGFVEKEEESSWGWFMHWVREEVIGPDKKFCVISDRHKGIKAVFDSIHYGWHIHCRNPLAVHRYCMQHVAENLFKEAGSSSNKTLKDTFKCRLANKKKPRRFEEQWKALRKSNKKAYDYLKKVGKYQETDANERPKFEKWAQRFDGGHRWGIMTSNGSESLNSVFRVERRLPVTAIVEGTWYKCAGWFNKRKMEALERSRQGEKWAKSVHDKLIKHDNKAGLMTVVTLGIDRGEFEVQVPREKMEDGRYRPFKYTVLIRPELEPTDHQVPYTKSTCTCQKPQLTGIPCSHVLAVCKDLRYDVNTLVDTRYSTWNLLKTWSGKFHSYGDEDTWPVVNRPKIIPDKSKINRGRRKTIRLPMTMDEMERKKAKRKQAYRAKKRGNASTSEAPQPEERSEAPQPEEGSEAPQPEEGSEAPQPEEPLTMATLQSGRRTSRPPSRSDTEIRRRNIQPGRRSLNVDPRSTMDFTDTVLQPRRASVSVDPRRITTGNAGIRAESARFSSGSTSIREQSGEGHRKKTDKGIRGKIRKFFSKRQSSK